jgi:alpha-glucosidase (family GH31 glycosyl hydrolase)
MHTLETYINTNAGLLSHTQLELFRSAILVALNQTHTYIYTYIHEQALGVINGLSFEEQFWSLSTTIEPAPLIYGLGQQKTSFRLPVGEEHGLDIYTLWARDPGSTPDHDPKGGSSLYGSHPFYMQVSKKDGNTHGVYVRSSNAMDVVLTQQSLTLRGTGGVVDLTVFMGPTPKHVSFEFRLHVCILHNIHMYHTYFCSWIQHRSRCPLFLF